MARIDFHLFYYQLIAQGGGVVNSVSTEIQETSSNGMTKILF